MKSPKFSRRRKNSKLLVVRRVIGNSMVPTLRPGQFVVATNLFTKPTIDDVVVVKHDRVDKIKRIKDIQQGKIFLVGDNTVHSIDSRSFGWLPQNYVVGRVIWPRV
jgi:phage repressor protein C with HTH and peptisase S24 domain